jgi:hypothetical protein
MDFKKDIFKTIKLPGGWKVEISEFDANIYYHHKGRWIPICGTGPSYDEILGVIKTYIEKMEKGYIEIVNGEFQETQKYKERGITPDVEKELGLSKKEIAEIVEEINWHEIGPEYDPKHDCYYYDQQTVVKLKEYIELKAQGEYPMLPYKVGLEIGVSEKYIRRLQKKLAEIAPEKKWPNYFVTKEQLEIFRKCKEIQRQNKVLMSKLCARYVSEVKKTKGSWTEEDKEKLKELYKPYNKTLEQILENLYFIQHIEDTE